MRLKGERGETRTNSRDMENTEKAKWLKIQKWNKKSVNRDTLKQTKCPYY